MHVMRHDDHMERPWLTTLFANTKLEQRHLIKLTEVLTIFPYFCFLIALRPHRLCQGVRQLFVGADMLQLDVAKLNTLSWSSET
jgi:hypothetical protein